MFSGGGERVHLEQIGLYFLPYAIKRPTFYQYDK